ncbi:ABC transporter permease [candidate division KSB1 bacterium]|nr:ABC transporter permease [candidate division KSB1 bacterium]
MFTNYLKITLRNLRHNKIYSFINIAGLAIGLACFILISNFVKNELSYDNFHEKAGRIYRAIGIHNRPGLGTVHNAVTPGPLAPALKSDFPQIASAVRIRPLFTVFCQFGEKGFYESDGAITDPAIFDIFTIPLKNGDPQTALNNPYSLVLNEDLAHKYFGDENPLGKTMSVHNNAGVDNYTITGVMKNYPENSHLKFSMLTSFVTFAERDPWLRSWNNNSLATYVLLQEGVAKAELEKHFSAFLTKHIPEGSENKMELYLQPLQDIHLRSGHLLYQTYSHNQGNLNTIYMFSAIALLVILIACINFMNLATARSMKRAREVGIRKVVGSNRRQLVYQFIGESVIISFLALALAVVLVQLAYPFFKTTFENRIIFKNANVLNAAASAGQRGASGSNGIMFVAGTNREVRLMMRHSYVDFDFIDTMQMQIVQGRNFPHDFAADTLTSVIINETAARELSWDDALGKQFESGGDSPNYTVIGVVKDYHFFSLHDKIEPLIMRVIPSQYSHLLLKIRPQEIASTLAFIEETWNKLIPGRPFEYGFLDDYFARLYRTDEITGKLFSAFAGLAILIACLGLFGLASFTAEQKTKEIGIRKVLGASVAGIVLLLSKEFTKWVVFASLIAFPVAYLMMQEWLADFVYRTAIQFGTFILAAILVVVIALFTVSFQAIKAALANPVKALRYE